MLCSSGGGIHSSVNMTQVNTLCHLLIVYLVCTIYKAEGLFIELRGGSSNSEGTVYVKRGSDWGLVCDDGWSPTSAKVVCRQLGFPGAKAATTRNEFKHQFTSNEKIFLDDVKCYGYETSLGQCRHREWFHSNCNTDEAAGVICATFEERQQNSRNERSRAVRRAFVRRFGHYRPFNDNYEPRYPVRNTPRPLRYRNGEHLQRAPDVPAHPSRTVTTTATPTTITSTTTTTTERPTTTTSTTTTGAPYPPQRDQEKEENNDLIHELQQEMQNEGFQKADIVKVTLEGGRNKKEGYVKVVLRNGQSGAICAHNWDISEAKVACSETGGFLAQRATFGHFQDVRFNETIQINETDEINETLSDFFKGENEKKVFYEVSCDGHERSLADCMVKYTDNHGIKCPSATSVAGVICTNVLPDIMPNITSLMESVKIQDRSLGHLSCAMEENCVSSSAYELKKKYAQRWNSISRRLLRFNSWIYNNGTADFLPSQSRATWEWHSCHMHYHSMAQFSHYDIMDDNGNRVAEGHKASFCLEDVMCDDGITKKYQCSNFGNQGIKAGCADVYSWDIDCQWIDITDLKPGHYIFKLNVNPDQAVPELSFDNNAALCDLRYTGATAKISNCVLARG